MSGTHQTQNSRRPLFSRLPLELRQMIWEETLNITPRVIDLSIASRVPGKKVMDLRDQPYLYLASHLTIFDRDDSHLMTEPYLPFDIEDGYPPNQLSKHARCPPESYLVYDFPVAVYVCRESRAIALKRFVFLRHWVQQSRSLYVDPLVDFCWLGRRFTHEISKHLRGAYRVGLDKVQNFIVTIHDWIQHDYESVFKYFTGVRLVKVIVKNTSESDRQSTDMIRLFDASRCTERSYLIQYMDYQGNCLAQLEPNNYH